MQKITVFIVILSMLTLGTYTYAQQKNNIKDKNSNKEKVVELLKSFETGSKKPISYINSNKYIQHNLSVSDGLEGFQKFVSTFPKGSVKVNTVRAFQDKDYVFTHTEYNFSGTQVIGFDIFRFEKGKIVEHWDNLQNKPEKNNPSNHSMTDGVTKLVDLKKTEQNKKMVEGFVKDVLMAANPSKITTYLNVDNYIQHNPNIADGLTGLTEAFAKMKENNIEMKYAKMHKLLGEGNFVLVVSEGEFDKKPTAYYDLFRVEQGKIVEHWDVIETIPDSSTWKNQNTKF